MMLILVSLLFLINLAITCVLLFKQRGFRDQQISQAARAAQFEQQFALFLPTLTEKLSDTREYLGKQLHQGQIEGMKHLQESLHKAMAEVRQQMTATLNQNTENTVKQLDKLTQTTEQRLKEISGQVEKRLSEGFEKTTATFTDIIKRLALIDAAQQKITELSSNVVSLQEVLNDKRSRGAFGEVQLNNLLRNMLPEANFSLQHSLSNGKRVDCILFLPEPTGNIAIDAKFPLEGFRQLTENPPENEQRKLQQQFKQDIKKHIQDIASKYIIPGETADGAMMFIPAEAIFAEIHAHYPELVETAHRARVWLVSPTTMMAILTTARAVLKDAATRKQVHIIQEHLTFLAKDFTRFQQRMDNLARHIHQAHDDVTDVNVSAKKIVSRFNKIEKVELESAPAKPEKQSGTIPQKEAVIARSEATWQSPNEN